MENEGSKVCDWEETPDPWFLRLLDQRLDKGHWVSPLARSRRLSQLVSLHLGAAEGDISELLEAARQCCFPRRKTVAFFFFPTENFPSIIYGKNKSQRESNRIKWSQNRSSRCGALLLFCLSKGSWSGRLPLALESERIPECLPWMITALGSLRLNLRSNGLHITVFPSSPPWALHPFLFLDLSFLPIPLLLLGIGMENNKDSVSQRGSYISWSRWISQFQKHNGTHSGLSHIPRCPWLLPMTLFHAAPGCSPGQKEK